MNTAESLAALLSFPRCQSVTESSNASLSRAVDRAALSPSTDSADCLRRAILADASENPGHWVGVFPATAECGSRLAKLFPSVQREVKSKRAMVCGKVRDVLMVEVPAGYVIAGSCLRFQRETRHAVRWSDGSAWQGRQHSTIAAACIDFDSYKDATPAAIA